MSNNSKGLPQNPFRDRPPVPTIDPAFQQAIDNMDSVQMQYAIAKIKEKVQQKAQQMAQQNQPVVANPVMRDILQDIDYCEKQSTTGFTVPYPPPAQTSESKEGENVSIAKALLGVAVDNLTKNPDIAKALASFLSNQRIQDGIADLLEGIGRKFIGDKGEK